MCKYQYFNYTSLNYTSQTFFLFQLNFIDYNGIFGIDNQ